MIFIFLLLITVVFTYQVQDNCYDVRQELEELRKRVGELEKNSSGMSCCKAETGARVCSICCQSGSTAFCKKYWDWGDYHVLCECKN